MLPRFRYKSISDFLACGLTDIMKHPLKEFISEKAAKLLPSEAELQNVIDTYDGVSDDLEFQ